MSDYDEELYGEPEEDREKYWRKDKIFLAALEEITEFLEKEKDKVFYSRQLQVKFEGRYFHWITDHAIRYLEELGGIRRIERKLKDNIPIHFFVHPANRYFKRRINVMDGIINAYSQTYINEINRKGGCALIFKYQLYELSQKPLVEKIKKELELPVDCPRGIQEGTLKRFENWHKRQMNVKRKKIHKNK